MLLFFIVGRRYQRVSYPLLRYGIIITCIMIAIPLTAALPILAPSSLMLKAGYLLIYLALAYSLLAPTIKPPAQDA
jgi:hypothetical protein